jgi:hypothetical protein
MSPPVVLRVLSLVVTLIEFSLGLAPAEDGNPETEAHPAPEAEVRNRIRDLRHGLRDVPLPLIIEALCGHRVLGWDGDGRAQFEAAAEVVRESIDREGVRSARINEAGNAVERHVLEALRRQGFVAGRPVAESGRVRTAGYPDLEAKFGGVAYYIEVKVLTEGTEDSTQRSFYLSPSADFKVTHDAVHLLVAVELEPVARETDPEGLVRYRAVRVRWLDLSRLRCDLKHEFNASNRDLYSPEAGLIVIER